MDRKIRREVVATLIKAQRRDLAVVVASNFAARVAQLLPGVPIESVFEPAPGLVHVILRDAGTLDLDDAERLAKELGVKRVNLAPRDGYLPVAHNALVKVVNDRFVPRQLKGGQMYRMEYTGKSYRFFAPKGKKMVVEVSSGDVLRLQTSRGAPKALEIIRKL